jgi:plasmid stabilization system protein ParE
MDAQHRGGRVVSELCEANALALAAELAWLVTVVEQRLTASDDPLPDPPPLHDGSTHAQLVHRHELGPDARLVLALALAPAVSPALLDPLFMPNEQTGRGHTEFGGLAGQHHSGFIPSIETALYLLAGTDLHRRFIAQLLFDPTHPLLRHELIELHGPPGAEPAWAAELTVGRDLLDLLTVGHHRPPAFGAEFPAAPLTTHETWQDLVLEPQAEADVREIAAWLEHGTKVIHEWQLGRRVASGHRSLFHGPPGTGKTMVAALLGKLTGREVYRVDLSMIISKYIGETEKNLGRVFDRGQGRDWILFFDEADAIFGKRTEVKDARDRFANQQVAYLLQRIEAYDGVVILATNLREHMDTAFARRFHSVVRFAAPSALQRARLWSKAVAAPLRYADDVDIEKLARDYEITGASIMNSVRYAALQAAMLGEPTLRLDDLLRGIRREFDKEGRTI